MFSLSLSRVAPVFVAAALMAMAANFQGAGDNWRRTADGWERVESWRVTPPAPTRTAAAVASARWDVHPAVVVLVQGVAVLAAMIVFPRPNSPLPGWLNESCSVAV